MIHALFYGTFVSLEHYNNQHHQTCTISTQIKSGPHILELQTRVKAYFSSLKVSMSIRQHTIDTNSQRRGREFLLLLHNPPMAASKKNSHWASLLRGKPKKPILMTQKCGLMVQFSYVFVSLTQTGSRIGVSP